MKTKILLCYILFLFNITYAQTISSHEFTAQLMVACDKNIVRSNTDILEQVEKSKVSIVEQSYGNFYVMKVISDNKTYYIGMLEPRHFTEFKEYYRLSGFDCISSKEEVKRFLKNIPHRVILDAGVMNFLSEIGGYQSLIAYAYSKRKYETKEYYEVFPN